MSTSVKAPKPDRGMKKAPNAWNKPLQKKKSKSPSPPKDLPALRERYLHLLLTLTGQKVTVTLQNQDVVSGVLHTATPFDGLSDQNRNKYVLKAITVEKGDMKPGSTLILDMNNVTQLHVKSCKVESLANHAAFTDSEISSRVPPKKTKELEKAGSAWTSEITKASLKGNISGWDQFKANEEQFGVKAQFDENIYTTKLDKSNVSRSDRIKAERLAKEIENTSSSNMHIAEERNQVVNQDYDEEDRYSGVLKQQPKPRLNYAQAAAAPKAAPPGFSEGEEKEEKMESTAVTKEDPVKSKPGSETTAAKKEEPKESAPVVKAETAAPKETKPSEPDELNEKAEPEDPAKSKLNPGAKEFSFNIGAKPFTPGGPPQQHPPPPPPPPPHHPYMDPNTGMPMPMMQPMVQHMHPGMMQHMNPVQYQAMRYPGQYPGPEQHMMPPHAMGHPPQFPPNANSASVGPSEQTSGTNSPVPVSEDFSGDERSHSDAPKQQPQEGDSVASSGPPPPGGAMNQHPHMAGHPPPFQQGYFPPGGQIIHPHMMHPPHPAMMQRPMYPMQPMPGPRFYAGPNGPMPYQYYGGGEDDMNYGRGRGGRPGSRGGRRGGGSRGRGRDGRGRGRSFNNNYNNYHSNPNSGRQTPQSNNNTPPPPQSDGNEAAPPPPQQQQGPPPPAK